MKKLIPLYDKLIVKTFTKEEKTKSGLYLPTPKEDANTAIGVVTAVGGGKFVDNDGKFIPLKVKAGDTILYNTFGAVNISVDGEQLVYLPESNVVGMLVEEEERQLKLVEDLV